MKIGYFDCFSGASGDMILGALIDSGLDVDALRAELQALPVKGWQFSVTSVSKGVIKATAVEVTWDGPETERRLSDIEALIEASALPAGDRERSKQIFRRLAAAEARVHGVAPEQVHFHEVGAVDAIVDVVGAVVGLRLLGVEKVIVSPLPLGRGSVQSAHGRLPLPAPATVELLQGVPVVGVEVDGETVTPTGAAVLTTLAASYGPVPAMSIRAVGYGAGRRETELPNALRLLIGEADVAPNVEWLVLLETNIDDLNPQIYDHLLDRLFAAGALDVWLAPVYMKKNRPATVVSTLCHPTDEAALTDVLFRETTTLGLRRQLVERRRLPRETRQVETRYGRAGVKLAFADGRLLRVAPEYDDCKRLAQAHGVPLREVMEEVERAAREERHE